MPITIRYTSKRREVLALYLALWKSRLWKVHLTVFIVSGLILSYAIYGRMGESAEEWLAICSAALIPLVVFALYPLARFKPQERVLTVDEHGVGTAIGRKSGAVRWSEVGTVTETADRIVIQRKNLNAFIIPARAFATFEERARFLEFVTSAHRAAGA